MKERGSVDSPQLGVGGRHSQKKASDGRAESSKCSLCYPGRLSGDGVYCGKTLFSRGNNMSKCLVA